jgi:hypothetical protein
MQLFRGLNLVLALMAAEMLAGCGAGALWPLSRCLHEGRASAPPGGRVGFDPRLCGGVTLEPYVFLRNFLDRRYAYVAGYPMPGFNVLVGLKVGI